MKMDRLFVLGMSKCGTTLLYHYLKQNSSYFMPSRKELHYYSFNSLKCFNGGPGDKYMLSNLVQSREEYESYFNNSQEKTCVDISPSYFYFPHSVDEMLADYPSARFLVLYRNPVKKVFSQYQHLLLDGRESLPFYEALKMNDIRRKNNFSDMFLYLDSALYFDKAKYLIRKTGRSNILFLDFDLLVNNFQVCLSIVDNFCGLTGHSYREEQLVNVSGSPKSKVISGITGAGVFSSFAKKIIPPSLGTPIKEFIRKLNTGEKVALDAQSLRLINEHVGDDYDKFLQLINED